MKLFTKFTELVDAIKSIDSSLMEMKRLLLNIEEKEHASFLPQKKEQILKNVSSSDEFIPTVDINGMDIKSGTFSKKKSGKNFKDISKKIEEMNNDR